MRVTFGEGDAERSVEEVQPDESEPGEHEEAGELAGAGDACRPRR